MDEVGSYRILGPPGQYLPDLYPLLERNVGNVKDC